MTPGLHNSGTSVAMIVGVVVGVVAAFVLPIAALGLYFCARERKHIIFLALDYTSLKVHLQRSEGIHMTKGLIRVFATGFLDPSERAFQARLRAKGGTSYAFSQAKIRQATKNYADVIGRGGFGDVYKGKLPDGQDVAAKVLSAHSHQSKNEFFNEVPS